LWFDAAGGGGPETLDDAVCFAASQRAETTADSTNCVDDDPFTIHFARRVACASCPSGGSSHPWRRELERTLALLIHGDVVSCYLADCEGVEALDIARLTGLKAAPAE
jgi:hypothetical protein